MLSAPNLQKNFSIIVVLWFCVVSSLSAKEYWVGIYGGDNSGISYKDWLSKNKAHDYGIGWSFRGDATIYAKADFIIHDYSLIKMPKGQLPLYYGVGLGLELVGTDITSGARIPIGLNYINDKIPFDFFMEVAPILHVYPSTEVVFGGAIGVRYHFSDKVKYF